MIKNFITVSIRNLLRNKVISIIHVVGLSIGISASLVIFLVIRFENSFDKFQPGADRIYRVVMDLNFNGVEGHSAAVPAPLAGAMGELTGIEHVVPVMSFQGDASVTVSLPGTSPQKIFKAQEGAVFTNAGYFDLMPLQWVVGSARTSMKDPFSVVLMESRARLYFPGVPIEDVVGRQLNYNGDITVTVTGIVRDLHETTDFKANDFLSYSTITKTVLKDNFMMDNWNDWMAYSALYLKLSSDNDPAGVSTQINKLAARFRQADEKSQLVYVLQPLSDMHFNALYGGFNMRTASKKALWGLALVASFLLALGCINFTNLASAQTSLRAREVGVRKSIGSSRQQLIAQFLGETLCITVLSTMISMALAPVFIDVFSEFIPQGVLFVPWQQPDLLLFLIVLVVAVTLLAGIYPSLVLSGLRPATILKGNLLPIATRTSSLRKILTVTQFMIAQVFIFGAFMVSKQVRYSLYQDLGYKKEAIVYFDVSRMAKDNREPLLNEIQKLSGVSIATTGFLPPAVSGAAFGNIIYKKSGGEVKENVQVRWGDPQYIDVYGLNIVAGRNVRNEKDVHEVLVNETYMKAMGFDDPREVIGEHILNKETNYTVVGVLRDFHASSLRSFIGPVVFFNSKDNYFFHVALSPDRVQWSATLDELRRVYMKFYPEQEFKYTFFDEAIAQFYTEEQNFSRLMNWAMGVSMLVSCLGLLGLVMHTAETRTKEVGIRKVLGASVTSLVSILSWDLVKLVVTAFALAVPISWWSTNRWLEGFAYKTSMSWWVFAVSGLTMITMAVLALSFQTLKTARTNPVDSLRTE